MPKMPITDNSFLTKNSDSQFFCLAFITNNISDGARVDAAVFGRGLRDR